MRALVLIHRWLGIAFCLLFAMWFGSGVVMHFVPFPSLSEAERVAGLPVISVAVAHAGRSQLIDFIEKFKPFDPGDKKLKTAPHPSPLPQGEGATPRLRCWNKVENANEICAPLPAGEGSGVREVFDVSPALNTHHKSDMVRLRLADSAGAPVFIVTHRDGAIAAFDGRTGTQLKVDSAYALDVARYHARARGLNASRALVAAVAMHDQWSVPNGFDAHRPLYRVALGDVDGTDLYVSSTTGEVVLDTTRFERRWNWAGSVVHWIYPTVLRKHGAVWDGTVWWVSLAALLGALAGAALGVLRLRGWSSPYRGWMVWHHGLGLGCAVFVLTWIFSGWLSMDHARLFSDGKPTADERARIVGTARLTPTAITTPVKEAEWFVFGGETVTRVVNAEGRLLSATGSVIPPRLLDAATRALGPACTQATLGENDAYVMRAPGAAPVHRITCGDVWFHIDGANGRIMEKLDASRRAYRWAYQALHTLDFPLLARHQALRTALILLLCGAGFAFSVTGVVIGWRRLTRQ